MPLKSEKTSYFMDKIFPEFVRSFLAAILLIFGAWVAKSSTSKTPVDLPFSFGINKNLALLIYVLIFVYVIKYAFSSFRNLIIAYRDSKQLNFYHGDLYVPPHTVVEYELEEYRSFNFKVMYTNGSLFERNEPKKLKSISFPRCIKDDCLTQLIESKTVLGYYNFYCPACDKNYKSKFSKGTLQSFLYLTLESKLNAENEKKLFDELPF